MRRHAPRGIDAALADALPRLRPATALAHVQEVWPAVVGDALADEARPVSERGGKVTVRCRSSLWAQELELLGADLLGRLNAALAGAGSACEVAGLRFVAGGR